jgi:hypothetical protein
VASCDILAQESLIIRNTVIQNSKSLALTDNTPGLFFYRPSHMQEMIAFFLGVALLLVGHTNASCEINSFAEPETVIRAGQLVKKTFSIDGYPDQMQNFCFASVRVMSAAAKDISPLTSLRGSQISIYFTATQAGKYSIHVDPLECGRIFFHSSSYQKETISNSASLTYRQTIEYIADQFTVANLYVTWSGWIHFQSTSSFIEISAFSRSGKSFVSLDGIVVIDCVTSRCMDPSQQRISYPSVYGRSVRVQVGFQVDRINFDLAYFNLSWNSPDSVGGIFNSSSICVSSQVVGKKLWTIIVQSSTACAARSFVQALSATTAWAGSQIIVQYQMRDAYSNAVEVDSTENSIVAWLQYTGSRGQDGPKTTQLGGKTSTLIAPSQIGILNCRVCFIGSSGLHATYYLQKLPVITPVAAGIQSSIDFSRGSNVLAPSVACPFSARWQGFIRAGASSLHTFILSSLLASNSQVQLSIDGWLQLDSWSTFPAALNISGTFSMIQNQFYSVEMRYECFASSLFTDFLVKLEWVHSNLPIEVVPSSNLIPSWDFNNAGDTHSQFQVSVQSNTICSATSTCYGPGLTIATAGTKNQFSLNIYDEYGQSPSNSIESVMGTATSESGLTFRLDAYPVLRNSWTLSWTPTISGQYTLAIAADSKSLCGNNAPRLMVHPGCISSGTSSAAALSSIIYAGQKIQFHIITRDAYGNKALIPDCSNLMNIGILAFRNGVNIDSVIAASASLDPSDFSQVTLMSSLISASGTYRISIFIMSSIIITLDVFVHPSSRSTILATGSAPTTGTIGEIINFNYTSCLDEFGNSVSQAAIFTRAIGPTIVYPVMIQPDCRNAMRAQAAFKFDKIGTYSIFATSAIGTGFMATYYSSINFDAAVVSQSCSTPYIMRTAGEREYPLLQTDTDDGYSVRWQGFLRKYLPGVVTLAIQVTNGASEKIKLVVDNIQILNNYGDFAKTDMYSATIYFGDSTTYHEISLEYVRSAKVTGISHSSLLAFGILDLSSNVAGIQFFDICDVRFLHESALLGVTQSIVISSNSSSLSALSELTTHPVSLSNVSVISDIEFTITPRDAFNSTLTTCASSIAFMRLRGILEILPVYQVTDQSIKKCRGVFSSLTTSGTFQLQIFAFNNHPVATYYQDMFFIIPSKSSTLSAPSLKWGDVSNSNAPGPIPFKMSWMAQINSSCSISIQCSSLISMSVNSLPIFPSTGSNMGKVVRIGQHHSWRPFFEEDRMAHFELWGLIQPEEFMSVQKLCHRNHYYSWGTLQNLVPISALTMIVMADVTSPSLCEISLVRDVSNLFVPIYEAIMKISCQRDQFGNAQMIKSLIIGTHFKKINTAETEFGDGCAAVLHSFNQNIWILSFLSSRSGTYGTVSGAVAAGSLAATFYDTEKKLQQQATLNATVWSIKMLSPFNLWTSPASIVMSFGGFLAMQANVSRAFQVLVQDAGNATFSLWLDGALSISATLLAGSSTTGLFKGSNFIRETTKTGESLIPIQMTCTAAHLDTKVLLLWSIDGSFVQIPTINMFSRIYNMEPPNVLATFEAKASPRDALMACSSSGTGLSVMTVGIFSTFSVFCKDGMGKTLDASTFSSKIRCSLLNVNPSLDAFYSTPCVFQSTETSVTISLTPSSMYQKLLLSIFGDNGFWATYYSYANWTNPMASRIEPSVDFSHMAGAGPITSLNGGYSIRWRGFCLMPSTGPLTMSFLKSAGSHVLLTDGRALLNAKATAVQMELLYSLNAVSNMNDNVVKLEWIGNTSAVSKVSSLLNLVLEDSQPMNVAPGFCSLKDAVVSGIGLATVGSQQSLSVTFKDVLQNTQCSLSNIVIAAYAVGHANQAFLFEKMSALHVAWKYADLYDVKLVLGKSRSGPEMTLYQDTACSILIAKKQLQKVDFDPASFEKVARCFRIDGLIELDVATSYLIQAQVDSSQPTNGAELPCSINLTVWGVGSNFTRYVASNSTMFSNVFFTTFIPGFAHFSLLYAHASNCNRIKLTLASSLNGVSSLVDSSNSGMLLESKTNAMRIKVVSNPGASRINIESPMFAQGSNQHVGNVLVESFKFSCREDNHVGSLCRTDELYVALCPRLKGRRCIQPNGLAFDLSLSAAFKSIITFASVYKQSLAIATGFGLWATYYEDSFFRSPFVSVVEPSELSPLSFKVNSSSPFLPISSRSSAKWAGLILSTHDSVTTISSNALPQGDSLTVWVDNLLVFDQRSLSASQSGTISLQSNTFFDIEIEYSHFGVGLANMDVTFSVGNLYFILTNDSNKFTLNTNAAVSSACHLVRSNALVTIVTFGIPVSFSLSCEDQFSNAIVEANDISVVIVSVDNPTSNPSYSQNAVFANGLIDISTVVYCCVSIFYFRVSIDDSIFTSVSYATRYSPPVEANSLMFGPSILTSGFAAVFTVYPRDVFNGPALYGNSTKLYLSHISASFLNFTGLDKSSYSIGSTYSIAADSQTMQMTAYVSHDSLLIHHHVCKSGFLVQVFSSDLNAKSSMIYEFTLSSIREFNVHMQVLSFYLFISVAIC